LNRVFLVASREFRQITATRGFWIMLLFIPLVLVVSQFAGRLAKPQTDIAYMIVDATTVRFQYLA